jgi:hypothetical protein
MRKSELNEIIRKRIIDKLKDTEQMKGFLLEVLDNEIKNTDEGVKVRYTNRYMQLAEQFSKGER